MPKDPLPKDRPLTEPLTDGDLPKEGEPSENDQTKEIQEPQGQGAAYEFGWSEEHFCLFRKEVKGKKLRGAIELSMNPVYDPAADPDAPAVCVFPDGMQQEVPHLTMAPLSIDVRFLFMCLF